VCKVKGVGIKEEAKYASALSRGGRYNPSPPLDRELKLRRLREVDSYPTLRHIGDCQSGTLNRHFSRLLRSIRIYFHKEIIGNVLQRESSHSMLRFMVGNGRDEKWRRHAAMALPIFSDFAVCDSHEEARDFIEDSGLRHEDFAWAMVRDQSASELRIFVYSCPRCRKCSEGS
jgi:hypothetical protein